VLGVWAHRQALATRAAGADVRVVVLYRPVPPRATLARGARAFASELAQLLRQPRHELRDGLRVSYVPFVSPSRERGYAHWGAWAGPPLALALRHLRRSFPFDLVHAHNAVPAGDAVRRARLPVPLVVSVHGGDMTFTARRAPGGERSVRRVLGDASLVLANSAGIEVFAREHGARNTHVVHMGADPVDAASPLGDTDRGTAPASAAPASAAPASAPPASAHGAATLVTVGHLIARKRHADVIRAVAALRERDPDLRYVVIGNGPEREALARLAEQLGISDSVELRGQLDPPQALAALTGASLFVMPSVDEAFGVAYIEAMARGIPAIGCRGEPGPEEIARFGDGMRLVAPRDPDGLVRELDELLSDDARLRRLGTAARATFERAFTWELCGERTMAAYREALERAGQ
jgi:glycosyltransferase involved in cell wall biosynthesis